MSTSKNTKVAKTEGVCVLNHLFSLSLPRELDWDILFQSKMSINVKNLGQITPFWLFFSPGKWHVCCINEFNARKGSLCHYKAIQYKLKKKLFHLRMNVRLEVIQ